MLAKLNMEPLDALEIDNSSSGEVMLTIAEKFSSFLEQNDKIGDLEKAKFVRYSALQSLAAGMLQWSMQLQLMVVTVQTALMSQAAAVQ